MRKMTPFDYLFILKHQNKYAYREFLFGILAIPVFFTFIILFAQCKKDKEPEPQSTFSRGIERIKFVKSQNFVLNKEYIISLSDEQNKTIYNQKFSITHFPFVLNLQQSYTKQYFYMYVINDSDTLHYNMYNFDCVNEYVNYNFNNENYIIYFNCNEN